jgi:hypothetical protein
MRWFIRLSSLDPKNILPISLTHKLNQKKLKIPEKNRKMRENDLINEKNYTQNSIVEKQKKNFSVFSTRPFRNTFSSKFSQKVFFWSLRKRIKRQKEKKTFFPKNWHGNYGNVFCREKDNLRIKKVLFKILFFMSHQFPLRFWGLFPSNPIKFFRFHKFLSLFFLLFESSLKDFGDSSEKQTKIHVEIHGLEKQVLKNFLKLLSSFLMNFPRSFFFRCPIIFWHSFILGISSFSDKLLWELSLIKCHKVEDQIFYGNSVDFTANFVSSKV